MTHEYREVIADYEGYLPDLGPSPPSGTDRGELLSILKNYLDARDLDTDWSRINDVEDETLINALAMMCPFDPREKQALLEAPRLVERAEILMALFKMGGLYAGGLAPSSIQ